MHRTPGAGTSAGHAPRDTARDATPVTPPVTTPRPAAGASRPAAGASTLSPAAQDHLKAIWAAGEWSPTPVTTTLLATRLDLSPSTVSEQVRRLAQAGLVHHTPYGPVALTAAGQDEALRVVRRHRLLETYLVAELGYSWDQVHTEAEVLEHVVSDLLLERIDAKLGHPRRDPHGDPIPSPTGVVERPPARPLADLAPGEGGVVVRIADRDPSVLRWCQETGLHLGAALSRAAPPADPTDPTDSGTVVLARLSHTAQDTAADPLPVPVAVAVAVLVSRPD